MWNHNPDRKLQNLLRAGDPAEDVKNQAADPERRAALLERCANASDLVPLVFRSRSLGRLAFAGGLTAVACAGILWVLLPHTQPTPIVTSVGTPGSVAPKPSLPTTPYAAPPVTTDSGPVAASPATPLKKPSAQKPFQHVARAEPHPRRPRYIRETHPDVPTPTPRQGSGKTATPTVTPTSEPVVERVIIIADGAEPKTPRPSISIVTGETGTIIVRSDSEPAQTWR